MRHTLRLVLVSAICGTFFNEGNAQNMAINVTGAAPNVRAILDVDVAGLPAANKKGMLIPRMTYAQRLAIAGLGVADKGLWVYQTDDPVAADPTLTSALSHGFWYYEGVNAPPNDWVRWAPGNASWKLTGNGNTNPAVNYLGTPAGSNDDLFIKTTNAVATDPQIRINGNVGATAGFVGVNLAAAPVERLEVDGGVKVGNTVLNTLGSIKFDNAAVSPNRWHYGNISGAATGWQRLENAETLYNNQSYCPVVNACNNLNGVRVRGTYDNSPVGGPDNTPYATGTGSNNRRGNRVQYLYPASELQAAGLCAGFITKISFYALTNDVGIDVDGPDNILGNADDNTPGADLRVEIRMGNGGPANFGLATVAPTAANLAPIVWDPVTEASANLHVNSLVATLTQAGWMDYTLTGAGFNYTGGSLVIDVSWGRSATNGNSPAVQLEEGLPYGATKWVQNRTGADINHGNTYQDSPPTLNCQNGITTNRPVTRFYGKVSTPGYGAPTTDSFIHYGGGLIIDSATVSPGTWADLNYRGPGSIRARVAVYDGSIALSDHVFDKYYEGDVRPEDTKSAEGYAYVGLHALKNYLEKERHLPNMPSREEWEAHGSKSLGQLHTGLWETVETQALHIIELEKDLRLLETMIFGKINDTAELHGMVADVNNSRRLTDKQKMHLTDALNKRLAELEPTGSINETK